MHSMLNTLGIVQIRTDRLNTGWKSWRGLGGKSLVDWVVRRVSESQRLDGVIVVAADCPERADIAALVPPDVPFFASSRPDALGQLADALFHYSALNVVRICLEHPLLDPVLIDRLITNAAAAPKCDYIGYRTGDGSPAVESNIGCFAELCKTKALRVADRDATLPADRDNVTRYLYTHPERFSVYLLPIPIELDRDDVRLLLAERDDWDHLEEIFEALGEELDWQDLGGYLAAQPALRRKMAALNESVRVGAC